MLLYKHLFLEHESVHVLLLVLLRLLLGQPLLGLLDQLLHLVAVGRVGDSHQVDLVGEQRLLVLPEITLTLANVEQKARQGVDLVRGGVEVQRLSELLEVEVALGLFEQPTGPGLLLRSLT